MQGTGMDARHRARGRMLLAAIAAAVWLCFAAPQALAAFGLTNLSAAPASPQAGANSDFSIALTIEEPSHDLRDLTIHLPPGLVGNPLATTTCTEAQLTASPSACPAASDVGDVSNDVTAHVSGFVPVPITVTGDLFNVVPRAGEPARFGIVLDPAPFNVPGLGPVLFPQIVLQSGAVLRQSDFGLDTVLTDLPNTATVAGLPTAIDIRALSLTLAGEVGAPPKGFIRNPTSCKTHAVGFDARAYDGQTAAGQATFTTTNCAAEPFTPELSASVTQGALNEGVEVSTTISQTIEEAGLATATVTLPAELAGNNAILGNVCDVAAFEAGNCPAISQVGTALAASPLQSEALTGSVYLVAPATPGLPDIGLDLRGALALKLIGTLGFNAGFRNVVTFAGLPDIPISAFTLTFAGGPSGLTFAKRDICQPPSLIFDALFESFSGASANVAAPATVTCTGGGSGGGKSKKPRAKVKLGKPGSETPRLKLKVRAGSSKVRAVSLKLPNQLRFADGREFARGATATADGKRLAGAGVTVAGRTLKLRTKAARRIKASAVRGAVAASAEVPRNSKFVVRVRDGAGKTTKIVARAP